MDKVANCFNRVPAEHCPGARIGHGAALPCRFGGCVAMALARFACGARLASAQRSANFAVAQMCGAFGAKARNLVLGDTCPRRWLRFRMACGRRRRGGRRSRFPSCQRALRCRVRFPFRQCGKNARSMFLPRFCGGLVCGRGYVGSIEARGVEFGDPFGCGLSFSSRGRLGRGCVGCGACGFGCFVLGLRC